MSPRGPAPLRLVRPRGRDLVVTTAIGRARRRPPRPAGSGRSTPDRRRPRRTREHAHRGSDSSYGARCTPSSVTIAAISAAGVTSKAGLRAAKRVVISAPSRSSIGIPAPVGGRRIDRRGRRDDVERDPVMRRGHGETIRADLVRGVAVRGDPVGAGDDAVDLAAAHQVRGRRVGDHGVRDRRAPRAPRPSAARPGAAAASRRPRRARAGRPPTPRGARRRPSRSRRSRARPRCSASAPSCRARRGPPRARPSAGTGRPRPRAAPAPAPATGRRASARAPRRG